MTKLNRAGAFKSGLLALLLCTGGCETIQSPTVLPNAWDYANVGLGLAAANNPNMKTKYMQRLNTARDFSGNMGQAGRDIAVARASQPQININVPAQEYEHQPTYQRPSQQIYKQQEQTYQQPRDKPQQPYQQTADLPLASKILIGLAMGALALTLARNN